MSVNKLLFAKCQIKFTTICTKPTESFQDETYSRPHLWGGGWGGVAESSAVTVTVQLGEKRKYKKIIQTIA